MIRSVSFISVFESNSFHSLNHLGSSVKLEAIESDVRDPRRIVMFKRSFSSKSRAGKTVKADKKKYDDQMKEKMQQNVDTKAESSPQGRW